MVLLSYRSWEWLFSTDMKHELLMLVLPYFFWAGGECWRESPDGQTSPGRDDGSWRRWSPKTSASRLWERSSFASGLWTEWRCPAKAEQTKYRTCFSGKRAKVRPRATRSVSPSPTKPSSQPPRACPSSLCGGRQTWTFQESRGEAGETNAKASGFPRPQGPTGQSNGTHALSEEFNRRRRTPFKATATLRTQAQQAQASPLCKLGAIPEESWHT